MIYWYDVPKRLLIKIHHLMKGIKIWILLEPLECVGMFAPFDTVSCSMHIVHQKDLIYWYDVPERPIIRIHHKN